MLGAAFLLLASAVGQADPVFIDSFEPLGACTGDRLLVSDIDDGTGVRTGVDMTLFENIWGYDAASGTIVAWPGVSGATPVILDFGRTQYLAAQFHVPSGASPNMMGWLAVSEYLYGQNLVASISTGCGDFAPASAQCLEESTSGASIARWRMSPSSTFCELQPDTDYYLNIKIADPAQVSAACPDGSHVCSVATRNNFSGS